MGPRWLALAFMGHCWSVLAFGDFHGSSLICWPALAATCPCWLSWALIGLHLLLGTSVSPCWLCRPLLACAGCHWSLLACIGFCGSLLVCIGWHRACIGFWGLPWVLIGFHRPSLVLTGLSAAMCPCWLSWALIGLCWLLLVLIGLHWLAWACVRSKV